MRDSLDGSHRSMRFLVFRSAIPFAYLAFGLCLFALFLLACWLLVRAFRSRPHRTVAFIPPMVLLLAIALTVSANLREEAALDPNPIVDVPGDLLGTWRDGPALLELRSDSSYRCNVPAGTQALCGASNENGRWHRDGDYVLVLEALDRPQVRLRLIRYDGILHLTDEEEDPDMWSGHLGFYK